MGIARLHHYVPQFYLRRFTDKEGMFWVWDKRRDRVFRTSPKHVAAGSNFYRLYEFAEVGRDPLTMEKQFSDVEGDVSQITDEWLDWLHEAKPLEPMNIPKANREIVSLYIALQFCRTADAREIILAIDNLPSMPNMTKEENDFARWGTWLWGQWLLDEPMKHDDIQNHKPNSRRRLSDRIETKIHTRWLWNLDMIDSIANRIRDSTWIFGRNLTKYPFITSDNPVAFHVHVDKTHRWVKVGFLARGAYPVFPLSPEIVLYCYDNNDPKWKALGKFDETVSPVDFSESLVQHDNGGQVFNAGRYVISPTNDFEHVREFAKFAGIESSPQGSYG